MDSIPTRDKVLKVQVQEPIQEVQPLCLTTLSSITEPLLKSTILILPCCILIKNLKRMVNRFLLPALIMISLGTYRLSAGAIQAVSTSGSETQSIGQMARLTYTYDSKYSVTGTIRHDGYSAFSANHKYGDFSSVGVNWNISKEKFMENVKFVNSLALRASYGTNGNQSIAPYSTLARISNGYYYYQGDANYTYTQAVGSLG